VTDGVCGRIGSACRGLLRRRRCIPLPAVWRQEVGGDRATLVLKTRMSPAGGVQFEQVPNLGQRRAVDHARMARPRGQGTLDEAA
jgi:hypothetical protein